MSEDVLEILSSSDSETATATAVHGAASRSGSGSGARAGTGADAGAGAVDSRASVASLVASDRYLLPLIVPSLDAVVDARGCFHEALAGRSHGAPAPTGTGAGTGSTASASAGTSNGSAAATAPPALGGAAPGTSGTGGAPAVPTTRHAAAKAAAVAELVASNPALPFPIGGNLTYVGAVHGPTEGSALAKMSLAQAILAGVPTATVSAMATAGAGGIAGISGSSLAGAVPVTPSEMRELHDAQSVDPLVDYARAIAAAGDIFHSAFAAGAAGGGSGSSGGSSSWGFTNSSTAGVGVGAAAYGGWLPAGAAADRLGGITRSGSAAAAASVAVGAALVPAAAASGVLSAANKLSFRGAASPAGAHQHPSRHDDDCEEPVGTAPHMLSDSWVADRFVDNEAFCYVCGDGGDLLCCDGPCRRSVHKDCLQGSDAAIRAALRASPGLIAIKNVAGLPDLERDDWRCAGCVLGTFDCFICGLPGQEDVDVHRCARMCGKVYHVACLAKDPRTRFLPSNRCTGAATVPLLEVLADDVAEAMRPDAGAGGSNADADAVAAVTQNTGALRIVRSHGESAADDVSGSEAAANVFASDAIAGASDGAASGPGAASAIGIASSASAAAKQRFAANARARIAARAASAALTAAAAADGIPPGSSTRFVCPFHLCASPTCGQPFDPFHPPIYYRCHACPSAYHSSVSCPTAALLILRCCSCWHRRSRLSASLRIFRPLSIFVSCCVLAHSHFFVLQTS